MTPSLATRPRTASPLAFPLVLAACLCLILAGCSDSKPAAGGAANGGGKGKGAPAPVSVATSVRKDLPVELEAIGTVEPFATVGIKSQVTGILEKVVFHEGEPVKAGDLLFQIDQRPFTAKLDQAKATLAKDQAALDNAKKQAARYLPAAEKGYVSAEQSDQAQTSVATLRAAIQGDEAAVANAQLDLANCTIRAPLSGYTGVLMVNQGNLVKAIDDQALVTINQVDPIKVSFTLAEQTLPELKKHLAAGNLEVTALPVGQGAKPLTGKLTFIDNAVETDTGTIRLKATYPNRDLILWPGQFVHVRLRLAIRKGAVVIPSRAVQNSQSGNFVYVVKTDETVELRPVTIGFSAGEETLIEKGLADGESVVTDGQLRLAPGVKVKAVEAQAKGDKSEAAQ